MPELQGEAVPQRLEIDVCRSLDRPIALRTDEGDDAPLGTLFGEFSMFDQWYEINSYWEGHFIERTATGAFKRTINNRSGETPVRVLLEHGYDPQVGDKPLGVPSVLEENATGPYAETPLLDTSYNRDLAPALRAGAYGQSFRFQVLRDEWVEEPEVSAHNPKGIPERTITEVRLIEFGPTVFPASPGTNSTTGLRSSTDSFYEQLARRDSGRYEDAVRRAQTARRAPAPAPAAPPAETDTRTEDPQTKHAEDPAGDAPDSARSHSDAPQAVTHSEAEPNPTAPERKTVMPDITPMTIEERTARQSEIRVRLSEIDSEHAGSALSEEARTEFDALNEEYDGHVAAIEDVKRRQEAIAKRAEAPGATETVRPGAAPAVHKRADNIFDLAAIRQQARSVDELPRLYRENAMRAVEQSRFPGSADRAAAQTQVERLLDTVDDEQGTLARRILATGSPIYDRAFGKAAQSLSTMGLTSEEQRALSLGVTTEGGFAVPFQLDPTVILTSAGSVNPLRQISRVEQIVGKEWQGITSAGITVTRAAEAAEASDNAPAFAQPTVKAERVQGFVPFSIEVDTDWASMRTEITTLLADAKDQEEATSFVTGTGVSPNANGIIQTLGAGSNVVANTFTVASLYALEEALGPRFRANAKFLANKAFYNLVRQFDTAGGANLWVRLTDGTPPELIGYKAHEASAMASVLAVAARYLLLGDFKQFLIVDRVGMSVELVPHLLGANRRPTGQRGLYAIWRNNSKILNDTAFRVLQKAA